MEKEKAMTKKETNLPAAINLEEMARPIQERLYREAFDESGKLTEI